MPFTALRFDTQNADAWSDALLEAGALSVEVSDPFAGTADEQPQFAEPGADDAHAWDVSRLVALFADGPAASAALAVAAAALAARMPAHDTKLIEVQDWVRATHSQFGPISVGSRLHIVPTWCAAPAEGVVVRLDPGLAFGTGSHPTTRLCLDWLIAQPLSGRSVLDYGCGSGVLAIAAAKLGADPVFGTDVDPNALRASRDNAEANAVAVELASPDALPTRRFDVVVSNILANPLLLLAPALAARVHPGGRLALSGILDSQADVVVIAYSRWFTLAATQASEGWTLVSFVRNNA